MKTATFFNLDVSSALKRALDVALPASRVGAALNAACASALEDARPLFSPAFGYASYPLNGADKGGVIVGAGARLESAVAAALFGQAEQIVLLGYTIGPRLENCVNRLRREGRVADAIILDAVGSLAVDALGAVAHDYVRNLGTERGLRATVPLNPGTSHWPVSNQSVVISLLPPALALRLGDDYLLRPTKSIVMAIGFGKHVPTEGSSCDFCSRPELCHDPAQGLLSRLKATPG